MDPDHRRIMMMSIIIMVGVVLILFDVSLSVLLTLTTVTGLLFLGVSGSLKLPHPTNSPKSLDQPVAAPKKHPMSNMKEQRHPSLVQRLKGVFGNLAPSIRWWPSHETKKVTQVKKIDEMLDTLIAGNAIPSPILSSQKIADTIEAKPMANIDIDPLKELSNAILEDDLLAPESPPSDAEVTKTEDRVLNPVPDTAGIPAAIGTSPNKVETMSLNEGQDIEGLTDLSELDFNDIELEESGTEGKQSMMHPSSKESGGTSADPGTSKRDVTVTLPPTEAMNLEIPKKTNTEKSDAGEKSLLGIGSNGGDDLLLALRSDVSQVKKPKDMSLFREMKDATVTTQELRNDLEEISLLLTSNNSKRGGEGITSRSHQNRISR